MPTLPQPGLEHDPGVRRRLIGRHDDTAGVLASVLEPGRVAQGDAVVLEPA
jgi:MOSC domain-containing protein YiiM